jgi:hypothetical protein
MRAKLTLLSLWALGTLGGVFATGCQTYDFEPVDPLAISQTTEVRSIKARPRKPNLMLLVDTSGSMTLPVDSSLPACKNSTGLCGSEENPCNTTSCPTRWSELQLAMKDFLDSSGSIARIGLARYPDPALGSASCTASTVVNVPLPADDAEDEVSLVTNANKVRDQLLAIKNASTTNESVPVGGTPTGQSLLFLGNRPELQTEEHSDIVLLLTDGLPNCNDAYPNPYDQAKGPTQDCFCTLTNCNSDYTNQIGCLDKNASVGAVQTLKSKQIDTIVIGFGADFSGTSASAAQGVATLNAMAEAGGYARTCKTDADCGSGDPCQAATGLCTRRFYQAGNRAQLIAALKKITDVINVPDACTLRFDATQRPSSQELVVVYVNKERLSPDDNTWKLTDAGIEFLGTTCERIKASSPANPVDIEVRAVQRR